MFVINRINRSFDVSSLPEQIHKHSHTKNNVWTISEWVQQSRKFRQSNEQFDGKSNAKPTDEHEYGNAESNGYDEHTNEF